MRSGTNMELSEGARRAYLQYDTRQNIAWMSQKKEAGNCAVLMICYPL
jgi:hypothetical protein